MTTSISMLRRIAFWLTRRTARTLPAAQREWSDAMFAEVTQIEDDREALRWALGCLMASYVEHLRRQPALELLPVRAIVVLLLVWHIFNDLFSTVLKVAYTVHGFAVADQLGRLTPHGDYHPLVPLMDAIPVWLHAVWIAAAIGYAISVVRYLRGTASPLRPFVVAFALELIAWSLLQPFEVGTGINGETSNSLLFSLVSILPWITLWRRDSTSAPTTPP